MLRPSLNDSGPQPLRRFWAGLFILTLVAVTILALRPANPQVVVVGWDKVNHVLAFLVLAATGLPALPSATARAGRWFAAWLLAFGGWIELAQFALSTTRQAEWFDWVADAVGIALGLALIHWNRTRQHRRLQAASEAGD